MLREVDAQTAAVEKIIIIIAVNLGSTLICATEPIASMLAHCKYVFDH
jgi:hypothetical protein